MTAGKERLTVYEIVNERRREVFVGATDRPIFELAAAFQRKLPAELADWDVKDCTAIRSVEFDLSPEKAQAFIEAYSKSGIPPGWRFMAQKKPR